MSLQRAALAALIWLLVAVGVSAQDGSMPVTLGECVQYGLEHSPRIRGARENSMAAAARLTQANAVGRVHVDANGAYAAREPAPMDLRAYTVGLSVTKLLYDGGRASAGVRQTDRLLEAAQHSIRETELSVALLTAERYHAVLQSRALATAAAELLALAERYREVAAGGYEAGTVPRVDVIRGDAAVASQRLGLVEAQTAEKTAIAELINAMGMEPGRPLQLAEPEPIPEAAEAPTDVGRLIEAAYWHRPELLGMEAEIGAVEAAVRGAQAGHKFEVSAFGELGLAENRFPPRQPAWRVGLAASIPLFDGGGTRGRVDEAKANVRSLAAERDEARQQVALEVTKAALRVQETTESIAAAREALRLARYNMELAEGRYRAGVGSSVEVTDARAALAAALTDEANSGYEYRAGRAALAVSVGLLPTEEQGLQ